MSKALLRVFRPDAELKTLMSWGELAAWLVVRAEDAVRMDHNGLVGARPLEPMCGPGSLREDQLRWLNAGLPHRADWDALNGSPPHRPRPSA